MLLVWYYRGNSISIPFHFPCLYLFLPGHLFGPACADLPVPGVTLQLCAPRACRATVSRACSRTRRTLTLPVNLPAKTRNHFTSRPVSVSAFALPPGHGKTATPGAWVINCSRRMDLACTEILWCMWVPLYLMTEIFHSQCDLRKKTLFDDIAYESNNFSIALMLLHLSLQTPNKLSPAFSVSSTYLFLAYLVPEVPGFPLLTALHGSVSPTELVRRPYPDLPDSDEPARLRRNRLRLGETATRACTFSARCNLA